MLQQGKITVFISIVLYCILFVTSFVASLHTIHNHSETPNFFQPYFEPAVMMTCGKGFTSTNSEAGVKLQRFLNSKENNFSCSDLPANLSLQQNLYVKSWYYTLLTVAAIWKVTGISWSVLNYLLALTFALSACAVLAICRLGMALPLAALSGLLFALAPENLEHVMSLRDCAKAPFMLLGILILILLVTRNYSKRGLMLFCLLLGFLIGIGFGFRPDVITLLPPVIVTLLFFLPGNIFKNLGRNSILVIMVSISFLLTAYPVYSTYDSPEQASCMSHVSIVGLQDGFMNNFKLMPSVYSWNYSPGDELPYSIVSAYATHFLHMPPFQACTQAYNTAANAMLSSIFRHFPADMLIRGYAAIYQILQQHYSLLPTIALLLCLACVELRLAIFLLLGIIYFGGFPALQFAHRHYFYLTFWYCWPIGFFLTQAYYYFFTREGLVKLQQFKKSKLIKKYLRSIYYFAVTVILCLALPLYVARAYQTQTVTRIINSYLQAPTLPIPYVLVKHQREAKTLYQFKWPAELLMEQQHITTPGVNKIFSKMLHLRLGEDSRCPADSYTAKLLYDTNDYYYNFTINLQAHTDKDHALDVYIPVYFIAGDISPMGKNIVTEAMGGYSEPLGVEVDNAHLNCISQIEELNMTHVYPMWITLLIPTQHWQELLLFQHF